MQEIILLPDGYNGHMVKLYITPAYVEGNLVKLICAEPGKEYMFRWVRLEDYNKAIEKYI